MYMYMYDHGQPLAITKSSLYTTQVALNAPVAAEGGLIPRQLSDCILQEWPGKEVCNWGI